MPHAESCVVLGGHVVRPRDRPFVLGELVGVPARALVAVDGLDEYAGVGGLHVHPRIATLAANGSPYSASAGTTVANVMTARSRMSAW